MQKIIITSSFLLLLITGFSPSATAQDVHTYVDRDSLQVGDVLTYSLVLQRDQDYTSITFPDGDDFNDENLQLIDRQRYRVTERRDSVVYKLQFFGTEDIRIDRKRVELAGRNGETVTITSSPVPVFFQSILAGDDEEFRPLKPIFAFAASVWPWILLLTGLLLAAWLIYRYYSRTEEKAAPQPEPEPVPFQNPLHRLELELNTLSGKDSPLRNRNFNSYYVRLGDAIRLYFEEVYEIPALEMTSGEILKTLRDYPAQKEIIDSTRKVLNEADMVKFARFEPDMPQAERALDVARQFLEVVIHADRNRIRRLQEIHEEKQTSRMEEIEL